MSTPRRCAIQQRFHVEQQQPKPQRIEPVELEREMRKSYLDYAMSVIVGRALPDVRDGL